MAEHHFQLRRLRRRSGSCQRMKLTQVLLPIGVFNGSQAREVVAGAGMVPAATQQVLTCRDEDMTNMSCKAKVPRIDSDGFELVKTLVTESQMRKSQRIKTLGIQTEEGFETEGMRWNE